MLTCWQVGSMVDVGVYAIALLTALLGPVVQVCRAPPPPPPLPPHAASLTHLNAGAHTHTHTHT